MRRGFEKAVAVYSFSAAKPGSPQSQAGPAAREDFRPQTSHSNSGTAPKATSSNAITAVETLPLRRDPAVKTRPFPATRFLLAAMPKARSVIGSKTGRNHVAPRPSNTQANARIAIPERIEN